MKTDHLSYEHINEKGVRQYRGFGYKILVSEPLHLATRSQSKVLLLQQISLQ